MRYEYDKIASATLNFARKIFLQHSLSFEESLGLPFLSEHERVPLFWQSLKQSLQVTQKTQLIIVFINQRETDTREVRESNLKTLDFFDVPRDFAFSLNPLDRHYLLLINGCHFPLLENEGVGRARKVLADVALGLWQEKFLNSEIHRQTDADVKVPFDYFSTSLSKDCVAVTYPYRHTQGELNEKEFADLQVYEKWLASYCEGLELAGSPYCYWALGSTLMFRLSAYERIRGFPNVRAGEDFHFLSKLRKQGKIQRLTEPVLEIRGRHSDRVPFGTGKALENMKDQKKSYDLYPVGIFIELKNVLSELNALAEHRSIEIFLSKLSENNQIFFKDYTNKLSKILEQGSSVEQKKKTIHQVFDALATLRWVNSRLKE